ncbi:oxidoreductase-like domain-containing protein [uncultured Abyssibacter sp.]|uniref:oxidoreductase-like domain-containing protein n=1 Tax=uncultured Abyssibacter sp. TaxID=2320202 RepID=UPI0032B17068
MTESRSEQPRPQPPEKPLDSDCCETGCDPCVWDMYSDQVRAYERALKAWQERNPEPSEID